VGEATGIAGEMVNVVIYLLLLRYAERYAQADALIGTGGVYKHRATPATVRTGSPARTVRASRSRRE
jgi:hypothetical protein